MSVKETVPVIEKNELAKKYSRTRQIISLAETIIFFTILVILIFTGLSKEIELFVFNFTSDKYIALLLFTGLIGAVEIIINFPFRFYSGYLLEHKYNLSNQTLSNFFLENTKGFIIGLAAGIPVLISFYFILSKFGASWWLVFGIFMFTFSVILGRIAPTLIMPLFYKFKPVENGSISRMTAKLCEKTGMKIKGVFTFDMSKNTKKANAAFTGIGKSKRIILGDTLINNFSESEIETVLAHEMGHYRRRHILKMIAFSTVMTFAGLFITAKIYESSLDYFGFTEISQIAALPLLFLYLCLFGLITTPLSNIQSRKYEWEADTFALQTTKDKESFIIAMEKLAGQNLTNKSPNKIIEFLFHSHPSVDKRIRFAKSFQFR